MIGPKSRTDLPPALGTRTVVLGIEALKEPILGLMCLYLSEPFELVRSFVLMFEFDLLIEFYFFKVSWRFMLELTLVIFILLGGLAISSFLSGYI